MAKINYNDIKVAAARTALFNNIKDVIEEVHIHDVLKLTSGENLPTHKMIDGNYPVFGGGGTTNLTHNIFNVNFETLAIGRVGARCGCVFKVPEKSWVTDNALYALTFDKRFKLEFLIHYLSYVDLNQYANRAAQPVISLKRISSIKFPLIDEERQNAFIEIIKDVENGKTYFGEEYSELNNALKSVDSINQLQTELTLQLTQLENLNQAILQEAVQGKLVKQDKKDEPASELLKRIKAEKATLIKSKKLKAGKSTEQSVSLISDYIIPKSWVWCKTDEVFFVTKLAGFEYTEHIKLEPSGEIPVLRAQNIRPLNIDKSNILYIDRKTSLLLDRCSLTKKCLLVTFIGAGIGDVATFIENERWHLAPNVAKMEPFEGCEDLIDVTFINYFLMSNIGQKELFKHIKATAQPSLSMGTIRDIDIPLPPLSEQKRIVAEIEKQLSKTKQLKEHIIANQQATEQLLKALLHQAFEVEG